MNLVDYIINFNKLSKLFRSKFNILTFFARKQSEIKSIMTLNVNIELTSQKESETSPQEPTK